ncbi:benomyl/methotrexate resistance protein [Phyllosticta capitalensis]
MSPDPSSSSSSAANTPIDDEKHSEREHSDATFAPIKPEGRDDRASLQPVQSHRSYAASDGYTHWDEEGAAPGTSRSRSRGDAIDPEKEFEVTWETLPDSEASRKVQNPRTMSLARRWLIVIIVSTSSLCVTYEQIEKKFHSSREVATLGLSLFVAGLGVGPMILSPLSEFYGRRAVYLGSYTFFLIWVIPSAVAPNMATILVARFLDGFSGSAFLSVAGGTVGDCFARHELSAPMMIYTASPFIGPELGPLVGGFINQYSSFRWTFYVMLIWIGVQLCLITLFVPETYHPALLRRKARKLRQETGNDAWIAPIERMDKSIAKTVLWSCIRPFQLLIFEPMCLNLCILSAILLGILYLFFGAFPLVFENNHGFTLSQVGLAFMGLFVGMILGILSDPFWRRNYARLVRQREEQGGEPGGSEPEFRLPPTIFGAIVVPIALFGSRLPCLIVKFGHADAAQYPLYAASALAANSFARSSFAAAFPLFGVQMYNNLGYQWASSVLAFLALAMAP